MARPRTPIGSWGQLTVVAQVVDDEGRWTTAPRGAKAQRYRARTKVRDPDGKLREVERYAPTRARAEQRLKSALTERSAPRATDELNREMTLAAASEVWLRRIKRPDSGLAAATVTQYESAWARVFAGAPIADMSLSELNRVPPIRSFLELVADTRGSGTAKTARTVLSLIIGSAVDEGAFDVNAVRQVRTPKRATASDSTTSKRVQRLKDSGVDEQGITRDTSRAMTAAERDQFREFAREDRLALDSDVTDVALFLVATGVRISEALALDWSDVDLDKRDVEIRGTKTDASHRVLRVAPWLAKELRRRHDAAGKPGGGFVFASATGTMRDRRNTARSLRGLLDRAGYPWATPHTFRRTVASILDGQGVPIAMIADYLGHADPSMTARVYLGRRGDTSRAADLL